MSSMPQAGAALNTLEKQVDWSSRIEVEVVEYLRLSRIFSGFTH